MVELAELDQMDEEQEYPFEFSVIMAVYNVEPFLEEALESLVAQDFGFERIQLIMVDDGSTDGSGVLCDRYAALYPDNVVVIHKDNGGVSTARNEGLDRASGRYVNFMDADDKIGAHTFRVVHQFFQWHKSDVNVVSVPLYFFDGQSGQHILNDKFKKGRRVINLRKECTSIQLHTNSSFIPLTAIQRLHIRFDTRLKFAEDAKFLVPLLCDKMRLGVVPSGKYFYRKRTEGEKSAIQESDARKEWWLDYILWFQKDCVQYCLNQVGYVPRFIQQSLAYDLQWRVKVIQYPVDLLSPEEIHQYQNTLDWITGFLDDDIILWQKNINIDQKKYLLGRKYGCSRFHVDYENGGTVYHQNTVITSNAWNQTYVEFIRITNDKLCIEGYHTVLENGYSSVVPAVQVGRDIFSCTEVARALDLYVLGTLVSRKYGFYMEIPLNKNTEESKIYLGIILDGHWIRREKIIFKKFSPVSTKYNCGYYHDGGWWLTASGNSLTVKKCDRREILRAEYHFLRELWKRNQTGERKAVLVRIAYHVLNRLLRKKVWLISDRVNKADDNGEALFQYLHSNPVPKTKCYFSISSDSPDIHRLKRYGKVIPFLGRRYKLLCLLAENIISSQGEEYIFRPFGRYFEPYRDLLARSKFVFLQHGVIKDDLSDWLNRYNKNISMFVTTTSQEYRSILEGSYAYTSSVVKLLGLPRYDRLYDERERLITIMPTWRAYLVTDTDPETGLRKLRPRFQQSEYYAMYRELLTSERLVSSAQRMGYRICFLNHPNMLSTAGVIPCRPEIVQLNVESSYRDIFAHNMLIVTDYSSVAFDFAYLRKPVLYYQKDQKEFFSGMHTYQKGYFDYKRDGFGEVFYSSDALIDGLIHYMENNCQLKDQFRQRIEATFPFDDKNNCMRVVQAISELNSPINGLERNL